MYIDLDSGTIINGPVVSLVHMVDEYTEDDTYIFSDMNDTQAREYGARWGRNVKAVGLSVGEIETGNHRE